MNNDNAQGPKSFWWEKSSSWFCCKLVWNEVVSDCQFRWVGQIQVRCLCIHVKAVGYVSTFGTSLFGLRAERGKGGEHGLFGKIKKRGGKNTSPLFTFPLSQFSFLHKLGVIEGEEDFNESTPFPFILLYNSSKQGEGSSLCFPFPFMNPKSIFISTNFGFTLISYHPIPPLIFDFEQGPNIWSSYSLIWEREQRILSWWG